MISAAPANSTRTACPLLGIVMARSARPPAGTSTDRLSGGWRVDLGAVDRDQLVGGADPDWHDPAIGVDHSHPCGRSCRSRTGVSPVRPFTVRLPP